MVDFTSILRSSVESVTQAFAQADRDLHEVITAVARSLCELTADALDLELVPLNQSQGLPLYRLLLHRRLDGDSVDLGVFSVGMNGYPIELGRVRESEEPDPWTFWSDKKFADRDELEQHFVALLRDRGSPIVRETALHLIRA
jgi:hypothetical protein